MNSDDFTPDQDRDDQEMSEDVRDCPNFQKCISEQALVAIELLARGRSFSACARELGVDPRTIYRWRKDPTFAAALARRRDEIWGEASDSLAAMVRPALDVLQRQLNGRHDPSAARAATNILRLTNLGRAVSMDGRMG